MYIYVGRGPYGPPRPLRASGPFWAGPFCAPLGPCAHPWALMGRALMGPPGPP